MDNKTVTVLIVDDIKQNIEILTEMLRDSYNVVSAESGDEALRLLRGGECSVDVVLLDIIMPEMDGCELLERINADPALRGLPVIAVTSDNDPETRMRVLELGAVDYVARGEETGTLKHRIKSVLRLCELDKIRSERDSMKKQLESERHLSALMDNIPGGIAIIKTDGSNAYCTFFNNELLTLFNMTSDEFNGQFSEKDRPAWLENLIRESGDSAHFSAIFGIGDTSLPDACQWVRLIAGVMGESGGKREIYCVFLDINAEKRQELRANEVGKRLRTNESHLEALLDNAPGGIAYAERDDYGKMKTLFASLGLAELLGYPDYESCMNEIGENPSAGISDEDVQIIRQKISRSLTTGKHLKYSFSCKTKDGGELWLLMRGQLVFNDEGRLCLYAFITNTTKEREIEQELRITAYFDPLTGLYNRSAFMKNAQDILNANPLAEYSIMKLNIGGFKVLNDVLGRDVGDKLLITIAGVLRDVIGKNGVYARLFSDHFAMLIPYSERSIHPQTILDAVQKAVSDAPEISHEVQFYIGVYKVTDRELSVDNMTDRASIACRSISGSFREHIAYYDDKMRRQMIEEQEICDDARRALKNKEFYVCYQPIYGIRAKKFVSAEALVRWNHPTKGQILPAKFIPVFEKNGFIAELDLYVLEQVCIYQKKRFDEGLPPFPISVNVSRMSLYNPNLFETISELTDRYRVDPKYFRIEITESAYNDNPSQLLDTIGRLRRKCYPVLMDDFGSGYSSLNTLKDIPIDVLKLDMKFMQGFEKNGKVGTIVTSVARMSKWLNVPLLAEGVETREQYEFLASIGCAYIQGFYFSRPVPENDFTQLVAQEEITAYAEPIETYGMGEDVNELLGSNALVSKFISSVFGGLGIYEMVDGKLELIRANDGYRQIMGYSQDDFSEENSNIWSKMPPEDAEVSKNACLEAMRTDKATRASIRRYDKNGRVLHLDGIHRRLGGSNDNPIFCIAFNNITDKIESDRIIEQSRSRIEQVLKITDSIILDIDFDDDSVFQVGDLSDYGFDFEGIINYVKEGKIFENITHPDDVEKVRIFHDDLTRGKISEEFRLFNKRTNAYSWWRFTETRSFNQNGKIVRLIGIGTNIDSEKKAELALAQANDRIAAAMNNFSEGILIMELPENAEPKILFSNSSFWQIIGKQRAAGPNVLDYVRGGVDNEDLERIITTAKAAESVHMTYHTIRSDGKGAWIELTTARSVFGESNSRIYMVIVSDVTEQQENRMKLNAILGSFDGGVALVAESGGELRIDFANDNFYDVLCVRKEDEQRIKSMLKATVYAKNDTGDLHIRRGDGSTRIVRIHLEKSDSPMRGENRYVIVANDVTIARTAARNRVAERTANAEAGLYDLVYEVNTKNRTLRLIYSRYKHNNPELSKPLPIDCVLQEWAENYIHPADVESARAMYNMPINSPDFTDAYMNIRAANIHGDSDYHTFSVVLVRLRSDFCKLFIRDMARVDSSVASEKVAQTDRLYQTVAEQTNTTVIEFDHTQNRVICSPSINEFWASRLSENEFCNREEFRKGLAVYPEDREIFAEFIERVYSSDEPQSVTLRLKMADENYKWCRMTISLNRSGQKVLKSLCTINIVHSEVIARKKAEHTDELLRRTVRHIPVGVGIFRIDNGKPVPVYLSDNIYRMYGLKPGSIDAPVLPTEELVNNHRLYDRSEGEYALEAMRADGSRFWVNVQYRVLEEQGELMLYAVITDNSAKIEIDRRKTVEEQMYKVLLEETGTIIFDYKPDSDELTYLCRDDRGAIEYHTIEKLLQNPDSLTLLDGVDRANFIFVLKQLCETVGTRELPVKIEVGGYPRRFKAFMKSVCDDSGKIFEIIGKIEDVDDEAARLEKIQAKAMYDALCVDIYNKATTEELIKAELERSTGGALMMIDVDDFKSINDTLGHMFGDEFLKKFASTIKKAFRDTDIVGRYGGDEFFVFMPHATGALAEKKGSIILKNIAEIEVPQLGSIKSSIGVAAVNPDNRSYRQILRQADSALYEAKNRGKNCVVQFDPVTMSETSYRAESAVSQGRSGVVLSSNPNFAASLVMRMFSALYTSLDVTDGINQALALLGRAFDVSRVYIFEDSDDGEYCSNTFEWCGEGVESVMDTLQNLSYKDDLGGNYRENMDDDGIFYCHDINSLSDIHREILERQNVRSVLQCSISDNGKFKGFVGFDECRGSRFWTQEQIDSLVFLSKVIAIFLMKERLKNRSEQLLGSKE